MTMTSGRSKRTNATGDNGGMRPRIVISLILGVIALPVTAIGLIDPLEGGIALLIAIGLGVAVRLISGVTVPPMTWIPVVATVAIGLLALVLAIIGMPSDVGQETGPEASAPNPLGGPVRILVWVYRLGVLAVLAGVVVYLVRIGSALRAPSNGADVERAS